MYLRTTLKKLYSGVQHSLRECKGVWWMPWLQRAMKDVVWLRKGSGRCHTTFDPDMSEWGNPTVFNSDPCMRERTLGSETSQYQEEKKAIKGTFFLIGFAR